MPSKKGWWIGRASTGIALSLKAVASVKKQRKIIMPSTGCAALVQMALYEGFDPIFVDLDLDNLSYDINSLEDCLDDDVAALLVVHQLGMPANIGELKKIIESKSKEKIYIIEDVCQALGGRFNGKRLGSEGDFSVFSFSGDKIISIGKGGYLGCNAEEMIERVEQLLFELPETPSNQRLRLLSLSHRNLYHAAVDLLRVNNEFNFNFSAFIDNYKELYYFKSALTHDDFIKLIHEFEKLDENNKKRIYLAKTFTHGLEEIDEISIPKCWNDSGTLWRYSIYIDKSKQQELTQIIRSKGHDASNHYWSLPMLFGYSQNLKNTTFYINSVLNLWVDKRNNLTKVAQIIDIISEYFAKK